MIVLGLVCLLLAAAITIGMLVSGTSQDVLFENRLGELTTSPLWIFVAGVLVTLLILFGLSFFSKGAKHRVARRKEMKRLRKVEQEHVHPADQTATAETAQTSESGADGGYRQQPDQQPVVELAQHEQGRHEQGKHEQGRHQSEHEQGTQQSGTSVTLGEQQHQGMSPGARAHGATRDQPSQPTDR